MGLSVDWGNIEETFIVVKLDLRWSYDDYQQAIALVLQGIRSKNHPVDVIIDVRKAMSNPPNLIGICRDAITKFSHFDTRIVVISNSLFWQTLYSTVQRMMPNMVVDICFTASVDESYTLIEEAQERRRHNHDNNNMARLN
ncbi:hypothetical protein G4Y79_02165 [Phototrophicus methaneseepsis]|uniref:CRAL-TRIO domain-containing protein n=1 Tax=Phototrophicus methaneseepsis TaxID=2710758 RepID=A0A7S8IFQ8_9CHLR|nr:hypothetical protein [Phototrophicus methaneseepsis]QPC83203.1 hypothetical protein G4Y79_02165 [Phototrophicus methaneseepsis]